MTFDFYKDDSSLLDKKTVHYMKNLCLYNVGFFTTLAFLENRLIYKEFRKTSVVTEFLVICTRTYVLNIDKNLSIK